MIFTSGRLARAAIAVILFSAVLAATAAAQGVVPAGLSYKAEDGPYTPVVVERYLLHDEARDKDLEIKLFYPKEAGSYPVIVISHGLYGSKDGHDKMGRFLSSHGYITIHPTHADSLSSGGRLTDAPLSDPAAWQNRVRDVTVILDSLSLLAQQISGLAGKPDATRIGVCGHSYGALTTMHVAGVAVTLPDGTITSYRDNRPLAFIAMSPQGYDASLGLTQNSWDGVERPVMVMTGSKDDGRNGETPQWRTIPYTEMPPGEKYLLFIQGAYHFTFTGKTHRWGYPEAVPKEQARLFEYVKIASVAFWDEHLKGIHKAERYLSSNKLYRYSGGDAHLTEK